MSKNQVHPADPKKPEVDENETKATLRQTIEKVLNGNYGRWIEYASTFVSFFSIIVYVIEEYVGSEYDWFKSLQTAILIMYLFQYCLELAAAQHRLHFFIGTNALVDLITISPIIFLTNETIAAQTYVKVTVVVRILRVVRIAMRVIKIGETEVSQQIFKIFLTILTLILLTSGILEAIENSGLLSTGTMREKTTIHEMIYFTVVTLSTVGYGDVVPQTELGRLVVMILIMTTIVLIPQQTNELIRLMGMQSRYARAIYKANSEVPHLVITGNVVVPALRNFCLELFHPDHGSQDKNAIILQQNNPSVEMETFLHNQQFELYLTYLQGNPMLDKDLKRAAATRAKTCVLLTNKYVSDSYSADHKNILTGLAIKKYVHHNTQGNMRLILQLIKPESQTHFYSSLNMKSNDQLIVVEEIKMNLLAKSCFSPGIISLLSNLIASAGDVSLEGEGKEWLNEYGSGMGHEIYRTDLSFRFEKKKFSEVAAIVYNEFNGIIFGLELDVCGQTIIRLNPGSYTIPDTQENNIHVYMICEDKKVADQVATYEMSVEDLASYQQQQNAKNKNKNISKNTDNTENDEENKQTDEEYLNVGQEENELLESDYTLLPEPVNLMQATIISIQDHSNIQNHIILCGIHPSIYYFLLPLRASYLKEMQPVVILSPEPPTNEMWDSMSRFPKIYYIKGSPLLSEDLHRANINFADKAVVLGQDIKMGKDSTFNDEMLDAESIFIYKAIKKCNKNVQIMIELVYNSNIEFLLTKDAKKDVKSDQEFKYEFTPLFAAGEVYISSIIDTLTSQAYYNPHIVTILRQLLTGGKQSNTVIRTICELAELKQSNLWQISVPEDYLNKSFGELFNYLAFERELIALGLYRLPGATDNKHPYVYTNPNPSTKLTHRDKVFVLAANMPNDLLSENIEVKKGTEQNGPYGGIVNPTQLSFDKEKKHDLNRSTDVDAKKKDPRDMMKYKENGFSQPQNTIQKRAQQKINNQLDLENLNQNSATITILEQIGQALNTMQQEIETIKENLTQQDELILGKVRNALRQEVATIGQ